MRCHQFNFINIFLEFCDVGCQVGPGPEQGLIMRNVECQTELMVMKCEHKEVEREEETNGVINTVRDFILRRGNQFPIHISIFLCCILSQLIIDLLLITKYDKNYFLGFWITSCCTYKISNNNLLL